VASLVSKPAKHIFNIPVIYVYYKLSYLSKVATSLKSNEFVSSATTTEVVLE